MKIKTSELTGAALDWAVAKCEGGIWDKHIAYGFSFRPSSDWSQGVPIIEREKLDLWWCKGNQFYTSTHQDGTTVEDGPTPLIAAMRCYVASKLGDDINIPEELL
jgi:hypothetical protein